MCFDGYLGLAVRAHLTHAKTCRGKGSPFGWIKVEPHNLLEASPLFDKTSPHFYTPRAAMTILLTTLCTLEHLQSAVARMVLFLFLQYTGRIQSIALYL